jgi:hypothetical protein
MIVSVQKPGMVADHMMVHLNDVLCFWYNKKRRTVRVIGLGATFMRCEIETENYGNIYNRHIASNVFRTFSFDKIVSALYAGRATDNRGVPYGDSDFARSNRHIVKA